MSLAHTSPDSNTPIVSWCRTENKVIKHKFVWTINNFSFRPEKLGEEITSSTFSIVDTDKWVLRLYPKGKSARYHEHVTLVVDLVDSGNMSQVKDVKASIFILDNQGEKANPRRPVTMVETEYSLLTCFHNVIKRDVLLNNANLLPDDKFTILCEIDIVSDSVNTSGQSEIKKIIVPETKLSLGYILDSGKFADVAIVVDGCEIPAHKAILTSRSDYFAAMFSNEMEESIQNRVEITDFEHEVVKELLYFIYTDTAPNLHKMAGDLLAAADKYSLEKLKALCEEKLWENISVETAAKILTVADLHRAEQLKVRTMDFIITNITDFVQTQGFQDISKTHLDVVKQLFGAISGKKIASDEPDSKRLKENLNAST